MNQISLKDTYDPSHWKQTRVSPCETHHILGNQPLYGERFENVLKFHEPGYAPVKDESGSYHINILGKPLYTHRFLRTFGFYEGYAAVESDTGWFHILPDGNPAYEERYTWCGNFQDGLCPVRDQAGSYFHINDHGKRPYSQDYCYVGDFRDGIAVVCRGDGRSTHIDRQGKFIHSFWYVQLDVFHKGFARAKDEQGWFHIKKDGSPAYPIRFASIEPFYNGQAHGEDFEGNLLIIGKQGQTIRTLFKPQQNLVGKLSGDLVGFWKSETIKLAVELNVLDALPGSLDEIGDKLQVPCSNLERVLRALWETGLVEKCDGQWLRTEQGNLFVPHDQSFMAAASFMWPRVQEAWKGLKDKVITKEINHHPTFKEETRDEKSLELYRCALKGYAEEDFREVAKWPIWKEHTTLLGLGQTAITLLPNILKIHPLLKGILLNEDRPLYHIEFEGSIKPRLQQVFMQLAKPWNLNADAVLVPRFLHYFPDKEAGQILQAIHDCLPLDGKVYIFEMVLDPEQPGGGLLDLNMLAEAGGKLRTLPQWKELLRNTGFHIEGYQTLKPHLQFMTGRKS